jgi:hypothetical protein
MKTNSTLFQLLAVTLLLLFVSTSSYSQNLLGNSNFNNGNSMWALSGMNVEVNAETVYGGSNLSNRVAEVDALVGLRQKVEVVAGKTYRLDFKASRRTRGGTPAVVGIRVKITGSNSGVEYVNTTRTYNNTTFSYRAESGSFSLASGSVDNAVIIEISSYNNSSSLGVIVDDVELSAVSASSLPVQWISFIAERKGNNTLLSWKTSSEINNAFFIVERSLNGANFDSIGLVSANSFKTYSYNDNNAQPGTHYYRLKQVDIDGKFSYSKVLMIKTANNGEELKVFPSLANQHINLSLNLVTGSRVTIHVVDAKGRVVMSTRKELVAGFNQQTMDVANLNAGSYYLQVISGDGVLNKTKSFLKIN